MTRNTGLKKGNFIEKVHTLFYETSNVMVFKRIWLQCVNPPIGSQVTNCHITWDLSGILARCQSTIPGGYQGTSGFLWCSVRIWEDRYTGHSSCKILSQGGLKMIKYWVGPLPLPLDWCISVVLITQTHLQWRILYHNGVKSFLKRNSHFYNKCYAFFKRVSLDFQAWKLFEIYCEFTSVKKWECCTRIFFNPLFECSVFTLHFPGKMSQT